MKVFKHLHAQSLQQFLKVTLLGGILFDIGMYIYCKRELQSFDLRLLLVAAIPLALLIVRACIKQDSADTVSQIQIKYLSEKKRKK
jgi:hypothetical protein